MKKVIIIMVTLFTALTGVNAMSYEQAREEALFLTDKMAYELNLNEEQYEACYEINFDYLLGVTTASDLYSVGWHRRNMDLEFMLLDWQYTAFRAAAYFYRPVAWVNGLWHFGIYTHYPHRTHFYFARPACYVSYRGGHCWRDGRSWYAYNRTSFRDRRISSFRGMRDSWRDGGNRGVMIGRGNRVERHHDNHHVTGTHNGGVRESRGNIGVRESRGNAGVRESRTYGGNGVRENQQRSSGSNDFRGGTTSSRHSSTRATVGGGSSAPSGMSRGGSSVSGGATRGGGNHGGGNGHSGGFSGGHGGSGFGARR